MKDGLCQSRERKLIRYHQAASSPNAHDKATQAVVAAHYPDLITVPTRLSWDSTLCVPSGDAFLWNHRSYLIGLSSYFARLSISELRCHRTYFFFTDCIQEAPTDIHVCLPLLLLLCRVTQSSNRGGSRTIYIARHSIAQGKRAATSTSEQLVPLGFLNRTYAIRNERRLYLADDVHGTAFIRQNYLPIAFFFQVVVRLSKNCLFGNFTQIS